MNDLTNPSENFLGTKNMKRIEIFDTELTKFKSLFRVMVFIMDTQDNAVMYESEPFRSEFSKFGQGHISHVITQRYEELKLTQFSLSLVYEGIRTDYGVEIKPVLFHKKEAILGTVMANTRTSVSLSTDEKITRIASAFLKIVSSVDIADDISITLNMILSESIKAFDHGHFGSVFVVSGEHFKIISQLGYADAISDFLLPIPISFLYTATQGKMDRIMRIDHIQRDYKVISLKTLSGEDAKINSSIVAPIFYRRSLYGMMSIDSNNEEAFNQDDMVVMTFIRDNIQSIIANQLNFLERTNQALTDHMTGLYNRHFLAEYLNSILERSKRYQETFSLVVFDIDKLKAVNDKYGHLVGDHLIKSFARSLQQNVRRSDILARFGGDEFIAIFLLADEKEISAKLEKINRHIVMNLDEKRTIELDYGFSYGIASYPKDGETYTDLIDAADSRMYQVKLSTKEKDKHNV